jgi:hypothetical protein
VLLIEIRPAVVSAENVPLVVIAAPMVMPACATKLKLLVELELIADEIVIVPESVPGPAATNAPVLIQLAVEEVV